MSIAKMCASMSEKSINRVLGSSLPASRVIVANISKHRFEIYTLWKPCNSVISRTS